MATHILSRVLVLACALAACGTPDPAPDDGPAPVYSHDVERPEGCTVYTTSPAVLLQCEPGAALVRVCTEGAELVGVYALPGAGEGQPFGVAGLVELDCGGAS